MQSDLFSVQMVSRNL